MRVMDFPYSPIPPHAERFRGEVRAFLKNAMTAIDPVTRAQGWMGFDADFSRRLGAAGLIGVAIPERYGGRGADALARYVVNEELLAAGAPVSAHWIADRQSAPLLLRFGTEAQCERFIPGIARGETFFCIGMSEPNAGSDLAAISTRATREGDGWALNGRKIWTTNAHRSDYMIALCRTGHSDDRHGELSQFIVDLHAPGVTVRPIRDLGGAEHFSEVFFDDVALDGDALVGTAGQGWAQVGAELALERSGPERFLSSMALLHSLIDSIGPEPDPLQSFHIGRLVARFAALRSMSLSVTAQLVDGRDAAWAGVCVKDLGTTLEQELPEIAQLLTDQEPRLLAGSDHARIHAHLTMLAPSFSLRGGTREILRGVVARGLGLR